MPNTNIKAKKMNIKGILGVFLLSMAFLICFTFGIAQTLIHQYKILTAKSLNVAEYVSVQAIGVEGEALISIVIDNEKIAKKNASKSAAKGIENYLKQLNFEYEGVKFNARNQINHFLTADKSFDIERGKKQVVHIVDSDKLIAQYRWKPAKKQLNISTEKLVKAIQKEQVTADKVQNWSKVFLTQAPLTPGENIVMQKGNYIGLYRKNEPIDLKHFINNHIGAKTAFQKTYGLTLLHVYEYQGKMYLFGETGIVESFDATSGQSIFGGGTYVDAIYLSFAGTDRQFDAGLTKLQELGYEKI